jgi:hypothetical protein
MKLPEGIGFTAQDFATEHGDLLAREAADIATAKLPALFEAWVKREGIVYYAAKMKGINRPLLFRGERSPFDTHQAYLMLPTEIGKGRK